MSVPVKTVGCGDSRSLAGQAEAHVTWAAACHGFAATTVQARGRLPPKYSAEVQHRALTTASQRGRQHTEQAGTTTKRPALPLVRDEEAQREPGTAALTWLSLVCGSIDGGHVELLHAEHSLHGSIAASLVRVAHQLGIPGRDDLPGQSVAVLQPAARAFLAAFGKPGPVVVDLLLVGAMDHERDRLVERELRTAVDRGELLPVQCEVDRQASTGRAGSSLTVVGDHFDLRVREHRDIELGSLLTFSVEPQVRGDPGHGTLPSS